MESSTKILRRMLDERGVEYVANDGEYVKETCWPYMGELTAAFAEYYDGTTRFACDTWCFTPAQAIAATLGATDAKPTQVESSGTCEADETDTWECVRDDLGGYGKRLTVHVMECTECGHVYEHVNGDYEYCPRCGRKREDVSE